MKTLTAQQYAAYVADPLGMDAQLRKWCDIPDNKYYSVSVWPDHLAGRVWITPKIHREVHAKKISKSDQS
jgi:hypothetical protein